MPSSDRQNPSSDRQNGGRHGAARPQASLQENLTVPVVQRYDVVVAGGGASGLIAAVSAARAGARTALIERAGCLGGTGTASMVAQWVGFFNRDTRVVGGLPFELTERVRQAGGSDGFRRYIMGEALSNPMPLINFPFNPEIVKIAADEMAGGAEIDVLLQSQVAQPLVRDGRVAGVIVQNVSGRSALEADFVVDATGDAVVAEAAGVPLADVELDPHKRQPCTLVFRLSNVDVQRFRAMPREKKREIALAGVQEGVLPWESLSFCSTPGGNDAISLMSRLHGVDALNAEEVSRAIMDGRQQIKRMLPFLRERVPGFEHAILSSVAEQLGVRETRRIVGRYTLTENDISANRRFEDSIALGAGPVDVHHEDGTGVRLWMPERPFEIPLRVMQPEAVQGLVVTGRAISATREANGGARHMGTAMALGEAAGAYAALSARKGSEASAEEVRSVLRGRGALISEEDAIVLSRSESEAIPPI